MSTWNTVSSEPNAHGYRVDQRANHFQPVMCAVQLPRLCTAV